MKLFPHDFQLINITYKIWLFLCIMVIMRYYYPHWNALTTCVFFLAGWRRGPVDFDLLRRWAEKEQARWGMFISFTAKPDISTIRLYDLKADLKI